MPKLLHLQVACAENRVIGRDGRLPWSIPEDLKFFHDQTAGQIVVLGRVCFETWPRVARDGRRPVVVTSRPPAALVRPRPPAGPAPDPVETPPLTAASLAAALALAEALPGEIQVCGGQRIYAETLALDRAMRLHLTLVHAEVPGDTFFPEWRHLAWRELDRRDSADANYRYTFFTLERP
jgi:dihydrofolate reductase